MVCLGFLLYSYIVQSIHQQCIILLVRAVHFLVLKGVKYILQNWTFSLSDVYPLYIIQYNIMYCKLFKCISIFALLLQSLMYWCSNFYITKYYFIKITFIWHRRQIKTFFITLSSNTITAQFSIYLLCIFFYILSSFYYILTEVISRNFIRYPK